MTTESTIKRNVEEITRDPKAAIYPTTLRVTLRHHTPHWKVFDRGSACVEFGTFGGPDAPLAFDAHETSEGGKSSKRVMITMSPKAAKALRDMLNEAYPKAEG